jgi:beta-barrel assembly-enhancing protease
LPVRLHRLFHLSGKNFGTQEVFNTEGKTMPANMYKRALAVVLTFVLVVPEAAFARYNPKPGMNFFSIEQDVQLGKENAAQVEKQMPLVTDAAINQYIQRLGQRLVAVAPGPEYPFTFKVVNQKEINAFALPGGPIFVNLGTIQAADSEAQLAGVIGHEMGHVIMRHSTNQASKQMLISAPFMVLGGKLGGGAMGQLAQLGIAFGVNSALLKYSRDAESQADLVGTDIIHDAGFDPRAMAQFFEKLEGEGGGRGPQFLSDHPNPGNRASATAAEAATLPKKQYSGDSSDFRSIKQKVSGMKGMSAQEVQQAQQSGGGTAPSGEISRTKDVQPSSNYQSLTHNAYTISYPQNWSAYGDQDSEVTIAPKGGASNGTIAYGVLINGAQTQGNLDQATAQLASQMQQSNGLKQVGNVESFTLNGKPAKSVVFTGSSPLQNEQERDWLVTQQRSDGTLMYLVFIAPQNDFKSLQPAFEKILRSFKLK